MATVTGYTAAKMKQIEDETVVDGTVDGSGHLILQTRGVTIPDIDAGSVIGPQGDAGPVGEVSAAELAAEVADLTDIAVPRFSTTTARNTAIPSPVAGQMCAVGEDIQRYTGSAWATLIYEPPAPPAVHIGAAQISGTTDSNAYLTVGPAPFGLASFLGAVASRQDSIGTAGWYYSIGECLVYTSTVVLVRCVGLNDPSNEINLHPGGSVTVNMVAWGPPA